MLKAFTDGAPEASGSLHHPSICHRAEVGQNYLDFSRPMGVSFSGVWVVDEGDGSRDDTEPLYDYRMATRGESEPRC